MSYKHKQFKVNFDPSDHTIIYGYRGSIAHNLHIPPEEEMGTDDVDLMGVCFAPLDCYFGLGNFETKEIKKNEKDIVWYEFRKFIYLLTKSNPNVLSLLWNGPDMYLTLSPVGCELLRHRDLFSIQQAYYSFIGYAVSQLKKMVHSENKYAGYMGTKRKAIVDKFGYDTKNACHLFLLKRENGN